MLRRRAQPEADASASANTQAVQQDWKDRDFLTSVQLGLSQLSAFLNEFGAPPIHTGPALYYFFSMVLRMMRAASLRRRLRKHLLAEAMRAGFAI